ncbi:CaiB/BaiF CoA transferase family protein [Ottowia thiooxydans]|uniref:CoA:oxalate CoA-transferase n=1 Tax=Ottowia thiooxydans TaxID=219182 RepID=A0ABV2Q8U9_9BURK
MSTRALEGVRVLDFTHVLSGPIATYHLALQGADVIKVESATGDTMRHYSGHAHADAVSPSFASVNAGKRSVVLDLKKASDIESVRRLVAQSDVVVENFRPGVMERLGLGYEVCRALRPDLVYCSISGFGQNGSLRGNPAIDQIIQSMSGLMTLSGEPGSPSMRVGFPIVDTFTGVLAAHAITTSLLRRERTGEGEYLDVAMLDAAMNMMISVAGPCLAGGVRPRKQGNLGYSNSPTADTFPTGDGEITLGVVRQEQFAQLAAALGREDLMTDPRFADRLARQQNAVALRDEVIAALAPRSALEWEALFADRGVAASAVRDLPTALVHPHLDGRALKLASELPDGTPIQVLGPGYIAMHNAVPPPTRPPRLGEHTAEVLAQLGESVGR